MTIDTVRTCHFHSLRDGDARVCKRKAYECNEYDLHAPQCQVEDPQLVQISVQEGPVRVHDHVEHSDDNRCEPDAHDDRLLSFLALISGQAAVDSEFSNHVGYIVQFKTDKSCNVVQKHVRDSKDGAPPVEAAVRLYAIAKREKVKKDERCERSYEEQACKCGPLEGLEAHTSSV